jgi:hypothetical protein
MWIDSIIHFGMFVAFHLDFQILTAACKGFQCRVISTSLSIPDDASQPLKGGDQRGKQREEKSGCVFLDFDGGIEGRGRRRGG